MQPQPPQHPRQRNAGVSVNFPPSISDSSHKVFVKTPRGGKPDGSNEVGSFVHQAGLSNKGGEYVSPGSPPAARGHQYQPYQQQQQQQQQQQHHQQYQEHQQRQLHQRAPKREDIGGIAVAPNSWSLSCTDFPYFLWQQPRSTLADINRHLPGHVHVDYSLTDGQQLVRDVAGRRRVMELMMRSSDQVRSLKILFDLDMRACSSSIVVVCFLHLWAHFHPVVCPQCSFTPNLFGGK